MARSLLALWITIALVAVVISGVVVVQIGGASIRSTSRTHTLGILATTNAAVLPGVPVTVRIEAETDLLQEEAVMQLRLPATTVPIRGIHPQEMASRILSVVVPCDVAVSEAATDVRLVLLNAESQAILARSGQLTLLPAGPDCVF